MKEESVFFKARKLVCKDLKSMRDVIFERMEKEMRSKEELKRMMVIPIEKTEAGQGRTSVYEGLNTNLISKQYSPMIIRKYNIASGWPVYIGIICDYSLSELDDVVNKYSEQAKNLGYLSNDIQMIRNFAGFLTDSIQEHYNALKINCVEGVAVFIYVDKCAVSSLYGDFMNHNACRQEFYFILNTLPHI
jgi:hypothetical protein